MYEDESKHQHTCISYAYLWQICFLSPCLGFTGYVTIGLLRAVKCKKRSVVSWRVRIPDCAAPLANSPSSMQGMRIRYKAVPKT